MTTPTAPTTPTKPTASAPINIDPIKHTIPVPIVRKMDNPQFMVDVVSEIANGGSLVDLAARMEIPFDYVNTWIRIDPTRNAAYEGSVVSRAEWFQQRILRELRDMCFVDIKDAYSPTGALLDVKDMPENVRRNIAGIETLEVFDKETGIKTGEVKKLKLWDKGASVERAMKHLKLLGTDIKVTVSGEVRHTVDNFDLDERIRALKDRKPVAVIEAVTIPSTLGTPGEDI